MATNMDTAGLGCVWELQRALSRGQAIPVIGPAVISPIKFMVSLVEFVAGTVFALIAGTFGIMSKNEFLLDITFKAVAHAGLGFASGLYSIGNMLSLGLLGLTVEWCMGGSHY